MPEVSRCLQTQALFLTYRGCYECNCKALDYGLRAFVHRTLFYIIIISLTEIITERQITFNFREL